MSDEFDAYLKRAKDEMFPKIKDSALSLIIFNDDPDPKLALEVGAAILYDRPLIVLALPDHGVVPPVLARIASAVIVGSMDDPDMQERIRAAMDHVRKTDPRAQ